MKTLIAVTTTLLFAISVHSMLHETQESIVEVARANLGPAIIAEHDLEEALAMLDRLLKANLISVRDFNRLDIDAIHQHLNVSGHALLDHIKLLARLDDFLSISPIDNSALTKIAIATHQLFTAYMYYSFHAEDIELLILGLENFASAERFLEELRRHNVIRQVYPVSLKKIEIQPIGKPLEMLNKLVYEGLLASDEYFQDRGYVIGLTFSKAHYENILKHLAIIKEGTISPQALRQHFSDVMVLVNAFLYSSANDLGFLRTPLKDLLTMHKENAAASAFLSHPLLPIFWEKINQLDERDRAKKDYVLNYAYAAFGEENLSTHSLERAFERLNRFVNEKWISRFDDRRPFYDRPSIDRTMSLAFENDEVIVETFEDINSLFELYEGNNISAEHKKFLRDPLRNFTRLAFEKVLCFNEEISEETLQKISSKLKHFRSRGFNTLSVQDELNLFELTYDENGNMRAVNYAEGLQALGLYKNGAVEKDALVMHINDLIYLHNEILSPVSVETSHRAKLMRLQELINLHFSSIMHDTVVFDISRRTSIIKNLNLSNLNNSFLGTLSGNILLLTAHSHFDQETLNHALPALKMLSKLISSGVIKLNQVYEENGIPYEKSYSSQDYLNILTALGAYSDGKLDPASMEHHLNEFNILMNLVVTKHTEHSAAFFLWPPLKNLAYMHTCAFYVEKELFSSDQARLSKLLNTYNIDYFLTAQ